MSWIIKSPRLILIILLLGLLSLCWWNIDSADLGTDEPSYTLNGDVYIKALLAHDLYQLTVDLKKEHPPLANWLYGAAFQAQHLGWSGFFFYRAPKRLASLLIVAAALVVYLIGRRLSGPWTGLLAAALLGLMPHVVAHARIAGLAAPSLLLWSLSLYCFLRGVERGGSWKWWLWLGLFFGLALGTRLSNGLILVAAAASLAALWLRPGQNLAWPSRSWAVWVWPLVGLVVLAAIWPRLWHQPLAHLQQTLAHWEWAGGPGRHLWSEHREYFLGRLQPPPAYYYLAYLAVTTPPLVLAGLMAWLVGLVRRPAAADAVLGLWLASGLVMSFVQPRQDGIRYVHFMLAPLALVAAGGLERAAAWLAGRLKRPDGPFRAGLAGLALAAGLWSVLSFWPYHLDYYNFLAGGPARIYRERLFNIGWWSEGVQAAAGWLDRNAPAGAGVAFKPSETGQVTPLRPDLRLVDPDRADFVLTRANLRQTRRWREWKLVFEEEIKGAPLVRVYRRRGAAGRPRSDGAGG